MTTLKDKIKLLARLQKCDDRIQSVLKRREKGPQRIQEIMDNLKVNELKLQEQNGLLELGKKERRKIEQEVQDLDSKIEKSQVKLFSIKSNKEYTAVLKEIEDLRKLKSDKEDRIIQIMEESEKLEQQILSQEKELLEQKSNADKEREEIEKERLILDQDIKVLEKERDGVVQGLDQDLWKRYLFLKERRGGLAVSSVIGGVCQTCHIGIPPQKFNELIKGDAIMNCPNCHRIIYWGEDKDFLAPQNML